MSEHTTEHTLDGYPIEQGLRVWDYDLKPGYIDLADTQPYDWQPSAAHPGQRSLWFHVVRDHGGRSNMNAERVWVIHPYDHKRA
jgi:hypothetical protein